MKQDNKIIFCFYSFGYSHLFFEKLLNNKRFIKKFNNPDFLFIAQNKTHKGFFVDKNYKVFFLSDIEIKSEDKFKYCDNKQVATQKKSIINLESKYQEQIYFKADKFLNQILLNNNVTHVLFSQPIEGLYGILLSENAKKLNVNCFVPHSTRFLGKSFFSNDQYETIEINDDFIDSEHLKRSKNIIESIRNSEQIQRYPTESKLKKPLTFRVKNFIRRLFIEKNYDWPRILVSIENNLSFLYNLYYNLRGINQRKYIQINDINQLPKKFIFIPLQYTPESSINIPNPYFVDQLRLIDLIRFNMPKDYLLIIKENPSMIGRRKSIFYKTINRLSGVRIVDNKLNTIRIIRKSSLTISVSGTACLEAYIYKIPSIVFGDTFFSNFTNKIELDFNDLSTTIKKYLKLKITEEEIQNNIALVLINTFNFKIGAVDFSPEILEEKNLNSFVEHFPIN